MKSRRKIIIDRFLEIVFFGGIFILPLVWWPWAAVRYEIPRVFFFNRWVELLFLLSIISGLFKKPKNLNVGLLLLFNIFIVIALISSLLGVDFTKSLFGNHLRGDGLITLIHLVGFSVFIAFNWKNLFIERLVKIIGIGIFLLSSWTIFTALRFYLFHDQSVNMWGNGSFGVSFGNPKFLAGYLLVTLPFTSYLIRQSKNLGERYFGIICLVLQIIAIGLTKSWAGFLGVVIFAAGWVILSNFRFKHLVFGVSIIVMLFLAFIYIQNYRNLGFVPEGRERIIRRSLMGFTKRPVLGWGWANTDYAMEDSPWPIVFGHDVYVDKAHGMILEVLVTTGVVGLTIYLALLGKMGVVLVRKIRGDGGYKGTLFLVFILYIFHSQTNIISIGEEIFFWLIAGIVASNEV
ncbi:O-antigen ligase family protein [Candidatus Gottesmanbacteria bacterium]|nr:O-antigen ligase family protein [Candidatus Gottesmanbacteria bacterium]